MSKKGRGHQHSCCDIQVLFKAYWKPDYLDAELDSPAEISSCKKWERHEMVTLENTDDPTQKFIRITRRGEAFVHHLLNQKLPVMKITYEVPNA